MMMARKSLPIDRCGWFFAIAVSLSGCISLGSRDETEAETNSPESEAPAASEEKDSGLSFAGLFSGKKKKKDETATKQKSPANPIPRRVQIGTVHLVHDQGGFVLIELSGMPTIPDQAELMTYSPEGKPTGKLRVSPERKGNFLVADILGGHPQVLDRVMLFGMSDANGKFISGGELDPDAPEVLE
jgi:hypothetical protein